MYDRDLVLVSDGNRSQGGLRLCSQLRSEPGTQRRQILIMVPDSEDDRLAKALELGVNNYLVRHTDAALYEAKHTGRNKVVTAAGKVSLPEAGEAVQGALPSPERPLSPELGTG